METLRDLAALRARLVAHIFALPWADAPERADAIPTGPIKAALARDFAKVLITEGLRGPLSATELKAQLKALKPIAAGKVSEKTRLKLRGSRVPGAAWVCAYISVGRTEAAITQAAAILADAARRTRSGGGRRADLHALRIARRCRDIYELATGKPGNLSASLNQKTGTRKYVGLFPFVAEMFLILGIEANAATVIKSIEIERRTTRAGTKESFCLELARTTSFDLFDRDGARLARAA